MKGIHASLLRAAAKSWQPLLFDVSVRYASCKKDYTYDLSVMRSDILPRDGTLDKIAEALYPEDGPLDICPVKVYENCFDRAISKAIFGHEERHGESMRYRHFTTRCVLIPQVYYNMLWRRQYQTDHLYR